MTAKAPGNESGRYPAEEVPSRVFLTENVGFAVYAVIRPSSKYAHQGREGGQTVAMKLTHLDERDEYAFHLENGNRYRREDLSFYARNHDGKFIKLR